VRRVGILVLAVAVVVAVAIGLRGEAVVRTGEADAHGTTIERYEIRSSSVPGALAQVGVRPAGRRGRPLLVVLHGRGGRREKSNVNGAFLKALAELGDRAPAVVFPAGGEASFWHARKSGDWARYVLRDVIPQAVRRLDADPRRVAIGGISMGGYGAYEIARQAPGRFCAVGGHSAALWIDGADSAEGAFDDAADFAAHDVIAAARRSGRQPWGEAKLWLDVGASDPFAAANAAFAQALNVSLRKSAGGHDAEYWTSQYDEYLRFYAEALATCSSATLAD
jgi:S-formylglutathione hydrolase FrmB